MAFSEYEKHEHIEEIQRYLHDISYFDAEIPRIIPDSIYGEETAAAVRSFQKHYGLAVSGEINPATWERITEIHRRFIALRALPLEVFPRETGSVLSIGDSGFAVTVVQAILHGLSEKYENLPPVEVTGIYTEETAHAVKALQTLSTLPPTGTVDRMTWNRLAAGSPRGRFVL